MKDGALVELALAGDANAFALLYYRYRTDVWNMAFFRLRNHHEAEDVVQDTFLRAHRALAQYQHSGDALRAWLLTICRNACVDRVRATRRRPAVSLEDDHLEQIAARRADHDQEIDFRRALAQLPAEEVEAFFVVDVLGFRSEEAARILGLRAASTLRSRVARARRTLAPAFADPPAIVQRPRLVATTARESVA